MVANLHFHKLGYGPKVLLAFHGIGQDGVGCFKPFAEHLPDKYTIYAFDLFFHGKSVSKSEDEFKEEVLSKAHWQTTIGRFLTKEKIDRFDVAGFSMGGRFALATLESFSSQIDKAFLIAPDGISEHPLYSLASRFPPARWSFRWLMQHPKIFFNITSSLQKALLLNSSLHRFTKQILDTSEKRKTIYQSWTAFRDLHFDVPALYKKLKVDNVTIYLFVGKYDKLLKPKAVKSLAELLPVEHYIILQSGHSHLVTKVAEYCAEFL